MNELSEKILKITQLYLGPASEVFLKRQAAGHMNGLDFEKIKPEHLTAFLKWIHTSSRLIIKSKADKLIYDLESSLKLKSDVSVSNPHPLDSTQESSG